MKAEKQNVMSAIAALGFQVFRNGQFHYNSSNTPDMQINNDGSIHCWTTSPFKGKNHGDLIDFIMLTNSNMNFKEAKNEAHRLLGLPIPSIESYEDNRGYSSSNNAKKSGFITEDFIANFEIERKDNFERYMELLELALPSLNFERKKEIAKKYKIGYSKMADRLIMPIRDEQGNCLTLWKYNKYPKTYTNDKGQKVTPNKVTFTKGRQRCPFNMADLISYRKDKNKWILLCGGEKDVLNAVGNGYRAITLGAENMSIPEKYLPLFKDLNIIICYDYDKAGFLGTKKIKEQLGKIAKRIKVWDWELLAIQNNIQLYKGYDLTDYLTTKKQ